MKTTDSLTKALGLLKNTTRQNQMSGKSFALFMWPDSYMHTKSSNQGHGACHGKAAWLAGGSYLSKIANKGLLKKTYDNGSARYYITDEGKKLLNQKTQP